jgi:DNA modification methylase
MMREVHRVLKPDGSFWLAIGDKFAADLEVMAHREQSFKPRSHVGWNYTFGSNLNTAFTMELLISSGLNYSQPSPLEPNHPKTGSCLSPAS